MATKRLTDHDRFASRELAYPHRGIVDKSLSRQVGWPPLTPAMTSLVGGECPVGPGEPRSRLGPFSGVAGKSMQQEHRITHSTEVGTVEGDARTRTFMPKR